MEFSVIIFLTSGLFLGWALGANDAANVFGTAVGTRMIRFSTAAVICSIFVILGAVFSGAGTTETLGKLGAINTMAGSFMTAFSAALAVYLMTKAGLPVSTTQAIVSVPVSVWVPLKRFQPIMPPTIACVVETGSPALVIR